MAIFLFTRLSALIAIWNMRRWGVYALFVLECLEVAMGLFVFDSVFTFPIRALAAIPSFLVIIGIWYLALRKQWHAFT